MSVQESTLVRPVETRPKDEDDLVHIFCTPCKRRARSRARRPVPYCGKQMPNRPLQDDTGDLPVCAVCLDLARSAPCPRCGTQARFD
ncbi:MULTISPECIES: hypothetical protein [unclassified Arthrobacter]|uniref:hypothetical protein n=1 Tax=unclassified Arthrobacter TaxID=235627 RepID=UPI001D141965|nr:MULTISPECIES: hypothetical protein [unclassified Arthrobacter]MCC3291715.1 hypothetical protein [Arthrobacter sp. zg-Y1110]MCC3302091.1 hypothetical protein [Arthrobacter sp. zg-Y895]MCQ1947522.1 hypothetical protein [Arthrobacter sp. zg-Y1116]MCQ1987474.1 hypothetical protein [Arthrobacter sp. zg-Y844]MCQ1996818.1 hypothetical protein [Arthrobacter sp. zg-Y1171]